MQITLFGAVYLTLASLRGKTPYLRPRGVIMTPLMDFFHNFFVSGYFPTPFCVIKVGWMEQILP